MPSEPEDTIMRHLRSTLAGAATTTALLVTGCGGAPASPGAASTTGESQYQRSVAYAECMRSHGVPSFPDPQPNGGFMVHNINPNSPQFAAASQACAKLRGPGMTPAQRKQALAQLLKYSACMRAHGVPNFPDPAERDGAVGISISNGTRRGANGSTTSTGIDQNSPQFKAAQQACQSLMPRPGGAS
jgi:hypothetical protein